MIIITCFLKPSLKFPYVFFYFLGAKPIIVKQPKDVIALEGEKVVITPEVAGIPPPSIAWYHDGGMVTPDYATEISDKGQLTFFCVEKKHAGVYRFTVSNNAGSIQGQVSASNSYILK